MLCTATSNLPIFMKIEGNVSQQWVIVGNDLFHESVIKDLQKINQLNQRLLH